MKLSDIFKKVLNQFEYFCCPDTDTTNFDSTKGVSQDIALDFTVSRYKSLAKNGFQKSIYQVPLLEIFYRIDKYQPY